MARGILTLLVFFVPVVSQAHCKWNHPGHCVRDVVEAPVKVTTQVAEETGKQIGKLGGEVGKLGNAAAQGAKDVRNTHSKAIDDVSSTIDTAGEDTEKAVRKAGRDVNEAAIATGHYLERQAQSTSQSLSDADKRIREGKFVDAVWHFGTDPLKNTEENAATLTQESTLVNALGQVAASAYGGPQGAAAYSAWYTYRATENVDLALRVGITVAATSYATGAAGELPSGTTGEMVKKAAITGAIGGVGVAASGGDEEAIFEGFLRTGGMVLVQDGYTKYTGHELDPRTAQGEAYCISTLYAECSPPPEAYIRNPDGSIIVDESGIPKVDMRYLDPRKPHVGIVSAEEATGLVHDLTQEGGLLMDATAKTIPVVQAGSVFHDQWAIQWDMSRAMNASTIVPAMVVTYYGTDGAINDLITKTAIASDDASVERNSQQDAASLASYKHQAGLSSVAFQCFNSGLTRVIQVDSLDNDEHNVCRVIYQTEKGDSVPWYAEHNADYCLPKGLGLVEKQNGWGWSCYGI